MFVINDKPRLLYISLMRMPTEKAHGLQIMQNCEAFADEGYQVALWTTRRINTSALRKVPDFHAYYGVSANFSISRLPTLDLMPLAGGNVRLERALFALVMLSFSLMLLLRAFFTRADVYYSRDELPLLLLSLIKPRAKLAYEVHQYKQGSRLGAWLQTQVCKRVGSSIPITSRLADDLVNTRSAEAKRVLVAHDGVRAARFAHMPDRASARQQLGLPQDAFIVGYVGRLHMMGIDKGVGLLVQAMQQLDDALLLLVGGPDEMAQRLRDSWLASGAGAGRFVYLGAVPADAVPRYLSALDVGVVPLPDVPEYAYYNSPLKLFEYMAAGLAIVASDLPSLRDVLRHEDNGLLYTPGDAVALADAIKRLRDDVSLRDKLAEQAQAQVMRDYTWSARARRILRHVDAVKQNL